MSSIFTKFLAIFANRKKPLRSILISLLTYGFVYGLAMNYLNIYLFPRRSLVELPLPKQIKDKGILSDLNEGLTIPIPLWLPQEEFNLELSPHGDLLALNFSDHVLALFTWDKSTSKTKYQGLSKDDYELLENILEEKLSKLLAKAIKKGRAKHHTTRWRDHDHDKIPDSLDIHVGMVKSMRNHARYDGSVHGAKYAYQDVPREIGVCTDVVVRAYRNAGINLHDLVFKDMHQAPKSYGVKLGEKIHKGYAHRRVRRLYPYFKRHFQKLSSSFDRGAKGKQAWLPGDLLFMNFNPNGKKPEHVGLIAGHTQLSGYPLLAHNAAHLFYASEHDVLFAQPLIARFRITLPK